MPNAQVNGMSVYYERSGTGPRLLFLNGSGATIETSGPILDAYRGRFELLVHDQRGLGRTDIPPGPYSMGDYADDALGLLDALGWDTCRVIGVSFGGMVAQELAVSHPHRVERLALLCTSPGGTGGSSYPLHDLAGLDDAARAEIMVTLLDTRFTPEYLAGHPGDRALVSMLAARAAVPKDAEVRRGEREQLMARLTHDVTDRLPNIACPTLVAAGRYDGIAPLPNSRAIANGIPDSELRVYEGGHAFFGQDQRAIPEILDFLART